MTPAGLPEGIAALRGALLRGDLRHCHARHQENHPTTPPASQAHHSTPSKGWEIKRTISQNGVGGSIIPFLIGAPFHQTAQLKPAGPRASCRVSAPQEASPGRIRSATLRKPALLNLTD